MARHPDTKALSAAIVYDVVGGKQQPDWGEGPFPVAVPVWAQAEGWIDRQTTDLVARSSYFDIGLLPALYGSPGSPSRWHRAVDRPLGQVHAWAHEIVSVPRASNQSLELGLLVIHCSIGNDEPIATLEALTRIPPAGVESPIRDELTQCLPPGWKLPDRRLRAHTAVFAHYRAGLTGGESVAGVEPEELSLWLLASATRLKSYRPSVADLRNQPVVQLSADWSALVLRDGIGFLGQSSSPNFDDLAVALVHSIYLDVLLLGMMQLRGVEDMSAALADRALARGQARDLIHLERRLFNFRRQVWRTETGRQNANTLLAAYQEQHSMQRRVASLISDIGDGARLAQSVTSARVAAALGIVSLAGVPFSIVYAGTALLTSRGWQAFSIASSCGIVLAIALATVKPLRDLMTRGDIDE